MEHSSVILFIQDNYIELLALLPSFFLLAGLFFTVGIDSYIQKRQKRIMLLLSGLVLSLVVQNYAEYLLVVGKPNTELRTVVASVGYSVRPVILLLFLVIITPEKSNLANWIMVGANAVLYTFSIFFPICFWIDKTNHFHSGVFMLGNTCLIISFILLGQLLFRTIWEYRPFRRKESWIPFFVTFLILFALFLDDHVGGLSQPVSFLTITIVISCILYYSWLHFQFVREHEQEMQTEQRIQMMLSQIKPHFLYNTLGAIEELCESDPPTAREATIKFSEYLRGNMNAISVSGFVPFERELSHAKLYLELEQLRFEDALQVTYDIRCSSFSLPALTLEPIVENAVRHGVRSNPDGRGTVSLTVRETPKAYEIVVEDNGPGFDPNAALNDGQTHVGIQNVRNRLKDVCGGELEIVSGPGQGTRATIRIPRTEG